MKAKIFTLLIAITLLSSGMVFGQAISLDNVEGLVGPPTDSVLTADGSTPITFNIRLTNDATARGGITNGFRVYSPDGATWGSITADTVSFGWPVMFNLVWQNKVTNGDGALADTVAYGGSKLAGTGLVAGFDAVAYKITIGPLSASDNGKKICIDSSWYPPTGTWKWVPSPNPSWSGPHCFFVGQAQDVKNLGLDGLPTDFALQQNYPNPFNPVTNIKFDVPTNSKVTIKVFNVLGQNVTTLVDEDMEAGSYIVDWNGTSESGDKVASGLYFYKMTAGNFVETKKMMLLK